MGTGYHPKTFLSLYCDTEESIMPHVAGRVLARHESEVEVQVWCRGCRSKKVYATDDLPEGYEVYRVRITAEDGPHLPAEFRPVPNLEEELEVVATSFQDAHERAEFAHSLRLCGQLTRYYINGEAHLNERF